MGSLRKFSRWLLLALCAVGPTTALAWGADGHRLIAEIAQLQLSPTATAELARLLALEPGASMVSVSTWADEKRSGATARLHYVNLPPGECRYNRRRDCHDGRCVVEAITTKVAILKSRAPDAARLVALKWVIHLVGDIHEPLHVGLASDKGGNLFQVRAFGRGSNLHAVWDGELIRRRAGGVRQLMQDASGSGSRTGSPTGLDSADPAMWAHESCTARSALSFYPPDRMIEQTYAQRWDAVLVTRLALAGRRLAIVLNDSLQRR